MFAKSIITATLFLFASLPAMADGLPVRYLGIGQGLSNNAVTTIYQDHHGFMWIGTYDGLNRYDGYSFRVFRNVIGDSTSLSTNNVYSLEGDSLHNIWVGTQNGLNLYDPRVAAFSLPRYRSVKGAVLPVTGEVSAIKTIAGNKVLIGSQRNGLVVFDNATTPGKQVALQTAAGATGNYHVHAIEYDPVRNRTWVCVESQGLYLYDATANKLHLVTAAIKHANTMKGDAEGNLWIGTDTDLVFYNAADRSFRHNYMPVKSSVISLCFDKQQVLWIGCDGAVLYQLFKGALVARPFSENPQSPQINSNAVYAVYVDRDERKWIGTLRGGLNIIESRPLPFRNVVYSGKGKNTIADNFILSFCEDEQHKLFIGTDGAGLRYWDMQRNTYEEYRHDPRNPASISSNFITNLARDSQQDIWISTWFGGINRLKHNSRQFEHFTLFNPSTSREEANAWTVYEDRRKDVWASATNDGSIYRFNRSLNKFEIFDTAILNLQCIAEDRAGELWAGNYTSLVRIDRERKKHQFFPIGHPVRCIHETRKGQFFLGTQGAGLLLFDKVTGKYRQFTTADGLPSNTILRMLEDSKGNIWLSTYNGIVKFNPATASVDLFTESDGLQSNQFSFNAALALSSGQFVFGGINGFNLFNPDSVFTAKRSPSIFLNALRINNEPIEKRPGYITGRNVEMISRITVPFNQAVLSLDFVALDYSGTDKIRYAYFMEGWDKSWNFIDDSRTANYSRLQEGDYLFKVKASQPGFGWSPETTLVRVTVLPPWYRTVWAYIAYLLFIFGSIFSYVRYTRKQERLKFEIKLAHLENLKDKELAEKKLSFFTNVSHEFRTPLSLIINPLKDRLQQSADLELTVAYRNARRLLSLVDQLLLFRQADSGADELKLSGFNIIGLCEEVFQCFSQQAASRHIHYQFRPPASEVWVRADYEKIEIALFNLLSNAFKFTPASGTILLLLEDGEEDVHISVSDSGCGIAEEDREHIFGKFHRTTAARGQKGGFGIGLYLVKHFVDSHKGTVSVDSKLNEGTVFSISLPKGLEGAQPVFINQPSDGARQLLEELVEETPVPLTNTDGPEEGRSVREFVTERKSILIIDDDQEVRQYLLHLFKDKYYVFAAADGVEGFELANSNLPDLILSDVNMEGMDGLQLCRQVKASAVLGHIPVILLTAASSPGSRLEGVEGGADDYITKPFDSQLLMARVETVLKNRNLVQQFFFDSITLQQTSAKVPAAYKEFMEQCIQVVEANLDTEDFTVQKFCKSLGMSRSTVYAKIKHVSGQSPNAFIRSIRIRRAAVLMIRENMNVNQAAFQVGIGDSRYFREQFVKLFGITPSVYIKKYRQSFNLDLNLIRPEGGK
ncbi:hybrid sensor histidine kinase/response regulator transcription factor [uncultured Chitinophaga sp.]|uniref:hybrid sensor histidine kinase/response regulator transcription factor n=1 Tax=uncultured Chitinophaga sp. TaxID=339340 RepID=UPI0025D86769|nr:hybrid sensor histidine kinase/response regulator transcription factor [uncultured Chitinophaga sp.]